MQLFLSFSILFSINLAQAGGPFQIHLSEMDQAKLTSALARIDSAFQIEEVIQEEPYRVIRNRYIFLDESQAFSMECSEESSFQWNKLTRNKMCTIRFNYEASREGYIESRDGFVASFATAKITDALLVQRLTQVFSRPGMPAPFYFHTLETMPFTHPQSGQKFQVPRLRIDCKQDVCEVMAIK